MKRFYVADSNGRQKHKMAAAAPLFVINHRFLDFDGQEAGRPKYTTKIVEQNVDEQIMKFAL